MKLSESQRAFSMALGHFLVWINTHTEHEVTQGDGYRDPRVFGEMDESKGYGNKNSGHKLRLAQDLNLYKNGKYCTDKEEYRKLGEYWEVMGGVWGGRYGVKEDDYSTKIGWDANHFEWPR